MAISIGLALREGRRLYEEDQRAKEKFEMEKSAAELEAEIRGLQAMALRNQLAEYEAQAPLREQQLGLKMTKAQRAANLQKKKQILDKYAGDIPNSPAAFAQALTELDSENLKGSRWEVADPDGYQNGLDLRLVGPDGTILQQRKFRNATSGNAALGTLRKFTTDSDVIASEAVQTEAASAKRQYEEQKDERKYRRGLAKEEVEFERELAKERFKSGLMTPDQRRSYAVREAAAHLGLEQGVDINDNPTWFATKVDEAGNFIKEPATPKQKQELRNLSTTVQSKARDIQSSNPNLTYDDAVITFMGELNRKAAAEQQKKLEQERLKAQNEADKRAAKEAFTQEKLLERLYDSTAVRIP